MDIDRNVANFGREVVKFRIDILQLLCLEKLCKEAGEEERDAKTTNAKHIISCDKIESFQ